MLMMMIMESEFIIRSHILDYESTPMLTPISVMTLCEVVRSTTVSYLLLSRTTSTSNTKNALCAITTSCHNQKVGNATSVRADSVHPNGK